MSESPIVFVIDDESSVRDGLDNLLRSVGLHVQTIASAREFLLSKVPDVPGCLVLDVRLPGLSGLELQRELARPISGFRSFFLLVTAMSVCRCAL